MFKIKKKAAFITGGTGFIGSALCKKVLNEQGTVFALVRQGSKNLSRLPKHENLKIVYGDLKEINSIKGQLNNYNANIDVFYHLAWEGVGNKERNDLLQCSNIDITLQSLLFAKQIGCTTWVATGSQAEYGPINNKIAEDVSANPTTLYGASKLSACMLSQVLGNQLGINTIWARVFSTYGPGDNGGWMLIDLINKLLGNKQPQLTLGEQLWDYLYIDDAAGALYNLGTSERAAGVYNLGSGKAQKLREIVEKVRDIINPSYPIVFGEIPYRPDQVMHLEADISKLHRDTGWFPEISLDQGLKNTIDYIKKIRSEGEL